MNFKEQDVLFQKLGPNWFVFTEVNGEVVYSSLPKGLDPRKTKLELYDVIEDHLEKMAIMSDSDFIDSEV